MLLRAPSAFSVVNARRSPLFSSVSLPSSSSSSILRLSPARNGYGLVVSASKGDHSFSLEEVENQQRLLPSAPHLSLARQNYSGTCEDAINQQIHVSYVYLSLYAYFARANIAFKGFAKFFKASSEAKRDLAEKLMEYQNKRGGTVTLESIIKPSSEYDQNPEGDVLRDMVRLTTLSMITSNAAADLHSVAQKNNDMELIKSYDREIWKRMNQIERVKLCPEEAALHAMELALALEKLTNEKLLHVHKVGEEHKDVQLTNFLETELLSEQVEVIKKISEYVAQLRRMGEGQGHGEWHFDQMLLRDDAA